jgi:uncharacterized membrane protein
VTTFQWLLALHVSAAFLLLGGTAMAGILGVLAQRARRPSEVALFLGLIRVAVVLIAVGAVAGLGLGLGLVHEGGLSYGRPWIVGSIVLLVVASYAGRVGGIRDRETRKLAVSLAGEDDERTAELDARLRDPVTLALSYGSGLGILAVLALMIWKPGG